MTPSDPLAYRVVLRASVRKSPASAVVVAEYLVGQYDDIGATNDALCAAYKAVMSPKGHYAGLVVRLMRATVEQFGECEFDVIIENGRKF